jgi:hypothetical protein
MIAECNRESLGFHAIGRRDVVARFDGGKISSDAGPAAVGDGTSHRRPPTVRVLLHRSS